MSHSSIHDARCRAPAAARNRGPILDVLQLVLPPRGSVLEIASGTGEHVVHFAQHLPSLEFQPSDPDPLARASIDAWVREQRLENVRPAIALHADAAEWPVAGADAVVCINMIHIAPWPAAEGLVRGAARVLAARPPAASSAGAAGGVLFLYGPFRRRGHATAAGNEAFDAELRRRNPAWGLRDLDAVTALAQTAGFSAPVVHAMPANNLSVVFQLPSR